MELEREGGLCLRFPIHHPKISVWSFHDEINQQSECFTVRLTFDNVYTVQSQLLQICHMAVEIILMWQFEAGIDQSKHDVFIGYHSSTIKQWRRETYFGMMYTVYLCDSMSYCDVTKWNLSTFKPRECLRIQGCVQYRSS